MVGYRKPFSNLLFGLARVAEDFLANDPFSRLVAVFAKRLSNLKELRPERPNPGRTSDLAA
jgi:hypothetical protein